MPSTTPPPQDDNQAMLHSRFDPLLDNLVQAAQRGGQTQIDTARSLIFTWISLTIFDVLYQRSTSQK